LLNQEIYKPAKIRDFPKREEMEILSSREAEIGTLTGYFKKLVSSALEMSGRIYVEIYVRVHSMYS
jgi:hypothetical protein